MPKAKPEEVVTSPVGDPTYIKNRERYFMSIALTVSTASSHPSIPGGCVLVRDREIIGDGRSLLAACKVEIDPITYAIGTCAKRGTPTAGAVVYSTRYPFSPAVFQCHLMGIRKIVVLAHDWEPFYKEEFRRAARLARELCIAIEPLYEDQADCLSHNSYNRSPFQLDEFDPQRASDVPDDEKRSI